MPATIEYTLIRINNHHLHHTTQIMWKGNWKAHTINASFIVTISANVVAMHIQPARDNCLSHDAPMRCEDSCIAHVLECDVNAVIFAKSCLRARLACPCPRTFVHSYIRTIVYTRISMFSCDITPREEWRWRTPYVTFRYTLYSTILTSTQGQMSWLRMYWCRIVFVFWHTISSNKHPCTKQQLIWPQPL